jgi:hypothetical protein
MVFGLFFCWITLIGFEGVSQILINILKNKRHILFILCHSIY